MEVMEQPESDLEKGFANGSTGSSSSPVSSEPQTQMDVDKACIYR